MTSVDVDMLSLDGGGLRFRPSNADIAIERATCTANGLLELHPANGLQFAGIMNLCGSGLTGSVYRDQREIKIVAPSQIDWSMMRFRVSQGRAMSFSGHGVTRLGVRVLLPPHSDTSPQHCFTTYATLEIDELAHLLGQVSPHITGKVCASFAVAPDLDVTPSSAAASGLVSAHATITTNGVIRLQNLHVCILDPTVETLSMFNPPTKAW